MEDKAHAIVHNYIVDHLDRTDGIPKIEIYTVWKCKALQNWKFLISSSLPDGMYYELTFNGDKDEWYLDAYKKFENRVIREDKTDTPQAEQADRISFDPLVEMGMRRAVEERLRRNGRRASDEQI